MIYNFPPLPEPYHGFYATPMYSPEQMRAYAQAALDALADEADDRAAIAAPRGWVLVPVEPSEEMLFAAECSKPRGYRDLYAAMLAAAPDARKGAP